MKDFNSALFSELNSSNEFQNLVVDFYCLKNNIENVCDINELFEMLGYNRISLSLRKPVEQIIDNYVKSLLGDMDLENLSISSSHSSLEIVLFKTSEKLQEENTQLKKEKDIFKKHLTELYNKIILEADKNGKLDLTPIKDALLEIRQNFKSIN